MKIKYSNKLNEVAIIEPNVFYDFRGEYIETWNEETYKDLGDFTFKQDDISVSVRHTLRGLHGDFKTWKLVQCVYGSLLQVVVDMRKDSDTYLQYDMFSINDKSRNQILIPPGFANGHLVISETGIFSYKQSTQYTGVENQFTVRWDDPKINIPWPVKNPLLSSRDENATLIK